MVEFLIIWLAPIILIFGGHWLALSKGSSLKDLTDHIKEFGPPAIFVFIPLSGVIVLLVHIILLIAYIILELYEFIDISKIRIK